MIENDIKTKKSGLPRSRRYPLRSSSRPHWRIWEIFFVSGSGIIERSFRVHKRSWRTPHDRSERNFVGYEYPGRWYLELRVLSSGRACLGFASTGLQKIDKPWESVTMNTPGASTLRTRQRDGETNLRRMVSLCRPEIWSAVSWRSMMVHSKYHTR